MSQKTLISYYKNQQKKDKRRISDLLSGRSITTKAKRRVIPTSSDTPAVAEASAATTTSAETTSAETMSAETMSAETTSAATTTPATFARRNEIEIEDVLIPPLIIESDGEPGESRTSPRKRRRIGQGEERHSNGNFSKILKYQNI